MIKNNILNDKDELDLVQFLKLIWYGKFKIVLITIISFLAGLAYNNYLPNTYINSLTIKPNDNAEFIRLTYYGSGGKFFNVPSCLNDVFYLF